MEQYLSLHWGREHRICYLGQHWSQPFARKLGMIASAHLSVIQRKGKPNCHVKPMLKQQCIDLNAMQQKESLLVLYSISCYPSHAQTHPMLIALFQVLCIQKEEDNIISYGLTHSINVVTKQQILHRIFVFQITPLFRKRILSICFWNG